MFTHAIDPIIFQIGPLGIRYYGLVYVLGFLLAYLILKTALDKGRIKNFPREKLDAFLVYLIIGVIVGARVFEIIFFEPGYYLSNPLAMVKIWEGGLAFHGGLFGAFIATYLFARKHKVRFYQIADTLVVPAALALGFGRIANFINAELVGTVTNVPWAVNFNNEVNEAGQKVFRHPSQLYEAAKNFFNFGVLSWLQTWRQWKAGTLFWLFVLLYGVLRFVTNIWRADDRLLGISMGQFLSLIMVGLSIYFLWRIDPLKGKK